MTALSMLLGGLGTLELWARKAIEYSKNGELFCGSLEDKSVEGNVNNEGLACEIPVGSFIICGYA